MALTSKLRRVLEQALGNKALSKELADAINSGSNPQASAVAKLGTTTNLVGVDGTGSNAAPLAGTESRLDAAEAKIDELIQALKDAGLMA